MDDLKRIGNLPQPELGKFGEYLANQYWYESGLDVVPCHRNEIDFYVNGIPYDVKTSANALRKEENYDNNPPKFYQRHRDGVQILGVAIYADCVILVSNSEILQQLDKNKLNACWREFNLQNGGRYHKVAARPESGNWLKQQKQIIREICESHHLQVRIMHRNGVEVQKRFGKWGPNSLIPTDPNKEDLTVFLWTEGESIYRVIAFLHSDIKNLPLHWYTPPNKAPLQTMNLMDFEQFRGKWCFISFEDFKKNFRFKP